METIIMGENLDVETELQALMQREGGVYLRELTTVNDNVDAIIDHYGWDEELDEPKISRYLLLNGEADYKTALAYNQYAGDLLLESLDGLRYLGAQNLYQADMDTNDLNRVVVKVTLPVFEFAGNKYILGWDAEKLEEQERFKISSPFEQYAFASPMRLEKSA